MWQLLVVVAAVAASAAAAAAAAATVPPPPHSAVTRCGFVPAAGAPCEPGCPRVLGGKNGGYCAPSCGQSCKSDADCGPYPQSACAACERGRCTGIAEFGNCSRLEGYIHFKGGASADASSRRRSSSSAASGAKPPVLPRAWNATFVIRNETDGHVGTGRAWYDVSFGGLRQDFHDRCPFAMLQRDDARNNGPCTVAFYRGRFGVAYGTIPDDAGVGGKQHGVDAVVQDETAAPTPPPASPTCCAYHFPVWQPDSYVVANATDGGVMDIELVPAPGTTTPPTRVRAHYWQFAYGCPWLRPDWIPAGVGLASMTTQRDVYIVEGTNHIARFNETLSTGTTDFYGFATGDQNEAIFAAPFKSGCIDGKEVEQSTFLQHCVKYAGKSRVGFLGYD